MLLGSHLSTSGGLHKALESAEEYGFPALALFVKSPRQWRSSPLKDDEVALFRKVRKQAGTQVVVAHASPPQNSLLLMANSFTAQPTRRHAEAVLQFEPDLPEELDCTAWYRSHKLGVDSSAKRIL